MSIKKVTRLSVFAGIVVFTLAFAAGTSWATEPCKETTTTTAKPKPTTTTVKAKPQVVTSTTVKPQQLSPLRPTTTTTTAPTTETDTQVVELETPLEEVGTVPLDDSVQQIEIISASAPTELAHTGAMKLTTRLAFLGAVLTGIGMVVLRVRNALAK